MYIDMYIIRIRAGQRKWWMPAPGLKPGALHPLSLFLRTRRYCPSTSMGEYLHWTRCRPMLPRERAILKAPEGGCPSQGRPISIECRRTNNLVSKVADALLCLGADVNATNKRGSTSLFSAITESWYNANRTARQLNERKIPTFDGEDE